MFKAADVVAPEAEAAERQRQPAAQTLGHGLEGRRTVPAPVDGELLPAGGGGAGKDHGVAFSKLLLQQIKHYFVVEIAVVVVHLQRVGAVVVDHVGGDALAEIGLETVHALVDETA